MLSAVDEGVIPDPEIWIQIMQKITYINNTAEYFREHSNKFHVALHVPCLKSFEEHAMKQDVCVNTILKVLKEWTFVARRWHMTSFYPSPAQHN